ncbi:LOW QUALITY PROTEIN: uncharacterized protein EMH_0009550 [Eimeria mitis]|uniref:Uncharacterized protein n=1 Tax=Eimeria mitis TaxID=44415 RepID=U6K1I3_9EIME|nr:LOW QUALITY PROTEIN: uncharacterized protein EMH_0009550 [Eimeria mitis]CDJ31595.1 hypothetical protein EMH_0009550 [Eimeria mitis]
MVMGLDWLAEHKAAWSFPSDELRVFVEGQWNKLLLVRINKERGLSLILPIPAGEVPKAPSSTETGQGSWFCALLGNPKAPDKPGGTGELRDEEQQEEKNDESPWPTALEHTRFDEWTKSTAAEGTPHAILEVLREYRAVFPDQHPAGLPLALVTAQDNWPSAYNKCPVFREPYLSAIRTPGETVHVELRQRRYGSRFQHPYLRICHDDLPRTITGNDTVLVFVDSLSKMAHFAPTRKTVSAADMVVLLADRLIRYHGFPDTLISDRDPRFTSEVWEALCSRFNIRRAMSSPYHPQTDGQTERVNPTLEQMLRTYIQTDEQEWENLLPALELAYNNTPHSSTELSPFEVMIGENPVTAADLDIVGSLPPTLSPPMTKLLKRLCDRARAHILKAKWRQKYYADAGLRPLEYKVGDQAWFEPRYQGPFSALERIREVAYRIALPRTYTGHNVFHVSQLVPHRPRSAAQAPQDAQAGWPPVCDAAGNRTDQFLVDYIMDQQGPGDSARYLVKWRGAPGERATWEPAHHLHGCPALLRAGKRRRRQHIQDSSETERRAGEVRNEDEEE